MSWVSDTNKPIRFESGSDSDTDPAYQWDTKRKLFSLVEVYTLLSAVLVTSTTEGEGGYVFTPFCLLIAGILQISAIMLVGCVSFFVSVCLFTL